MAIAAKAGFGGQTYCENQLAIEGFAKLSRPSR